MSKSVFELYVYDSAVFCALHDQLASLDTHAQLTRCFSAVAQLLVGLWLVLYVRQLTVIKSRRCFSMI